MDFVSIICFADTGSPTINIQKVVGNTTTDVMASPLTCNGTATTSFSVASLAKTDKLNFVMVSAGGSAHRVTVAIETRTTN